MEKISSSKKLDLLRDASKVNGAFTQQRWGDEHYYICRHGLWMPMAGRLSLRALTLASSTSQAAPAVILNSGLSQNTAVATIAQGLSLIRDGSADWLLLKAGDTWVNQEIGYIDFSGRSGTEPILISSYGTGVRPLIETGPNGAARYR